MTGAGGRGPGLLVAALGLSSLLGVGAVRSLEQAPGMLAAWLDGLLVAALPHAEAPSPFASAPSPPRVLPPEYAALAREAWALYADEVLGSAALGRGVARDRLVPVVQTRPASHEIVLRVPRHSVAKGAPVAHRDVLLGFVASLSADGERAVVRLLGHPGSRPVAGEWRAAAGARPVHFLAYGRGDHLAVENRSSSVPPPPEQLARTRDVKFLGDALPPGLLLGLLEAREHDEPGGGLGPGDAVGLGLPVGDLAVRVRPLLDAMELGVVTVPVADTEAAAGAPTRGPVPGRLLATCGAGGRRRLDRGAADGLEVGDLVVQDGVLVGTVAVVGRGSSIVDQGLPPGRLLVVPSDGRLVPCGLGADSWPAGWTPEPGQVVVGGHAEHGGLLVGRVAALTADGGALVLDRADVDPRRPVLVLPR